MRCKPRPTVRAVCVAGGKKLLQPHAGLEALYAALWCAASLGRVRASLLGAIGGVLVVGGDSGLCVD